MLRSSVKSLTKNRLNAICNVKPNLLNGLLKINSKYLKINSKYLRLKWD